MKQRIITAIIALAVFFPLVIIGGLPFTLAIYTLASIGLFELLRMKNIRIFSVEGILTWIMLAILLMPSTWTKDVLQLTSYTKMELLFAFILILLIYTVISKNRFTFEHAAFTAFSALYLGIGFYFLIETRFYGFEYVFYALLVIWTTDSGAYFTGRKIGKRKLWPEISPNKTVEGFLGGILCAVLFAFVFQLFYPIAPSYFMLTIVTIIASIVGQLGDLVESALKRHFAVKDSGNLLPGHGGILDRFDSLLFVLPLIHFLHLVG
ncbi:phosphatidate cytidylyltransferase [Sporosarcina highlanderae]|uniref:Phosphatidate cytidylyltransferase n=1 Tax=Sporosarcina highlanderae TaxID=3035916 RepID=A0ABT8JR66_9BACL|nr:phosphatidate cytidylyltransferase [Sporosarcina highlanderae]MDN4607432.1 phosphatidate cytidylyltransferase [Sporosarcina highlanderae]